ncbi:hypothetical protein BMEGG_05621 [Priestia megaterium]
MKSFKRYLPLLFIILGIFCLVAVSNSLYVDKHFLKALIGIVVLMSFPTLFLFIYRKVMRKK